MTRWLGFAGAFALGFAAGLLALPAYEEWERRQRAQHDWEKGRDRRGADR